MQFQRTIGLLCLTGVAAWLGACSGRIDGGGDKTDGAGGQTNGGNGGRPPGQDVTPIPPSDDCPTPDVGFGRLRRLTKGEYNRAVRDILGDDTRPGDKFVSDEREGNFYVNSQALITETIYTQYLESAEAIAGRFVARTGTTDCAGGTALDAQTKCTQTFLDDLGARLYRRPLRVEEKQALLAGYSETRKMGTHADGLRQVLHSMLQSPHFLYHTELGDDPASTNSVVKLSGYEVASRLSFFLLGSGPDKTAMQAAAAGEFNTPAGIAKQAVAMAKDKRAVDRINDFYSQWLRFDRLDQYILRDDLRTAVRDETLGFLRTQYEKPKLSVKDLLTSRDAQVTTLTREIYLPGSAASANNIVTLDSKTRAGLLTRAAFIAASHNVPARGKFIFNELLCNNIALPPDLDTSLAEAKPNENPRQRFDRHRESAACRGCHMVLDPPGHTFWHYDEVGKYRTRIGDWQIDASGALAGTESSDGPVYGAVELSEKLATVPEVSQCIVRQWFRFAMGREPDDARDSCSLRKAEKQFIEQGADLKSLAVLIAQSDAFRFRRVASAVPATPTEGVKK